jgi:HNH endonuclease
MHSSAYLATSADRERFFEKVDPSGECHLWRSARCAAGYGQFTLNRYSLKAHRVVWAWTHGPIPDGLCVLHRCDNPPCVNPAHLWLGTIADNNNDKARKGRGRTPQGERHGRAKLTDAEAVTIRALQGVERQIDLAARFGVCPHTIRRIWRGSHWRHLL